MRDAPGDDEEPGFVPEVHESGHVLEAEVWNAARNWQVARGLDVLSLFAEAPSLFRAPAQSENGVADQKGVGDLARAVVKIASEATLEADYRRAFGVATEVLSSKESISLGDEAEPD